MSWWSGAWTGSILHLMWLRRTGLPSEAPCSTEVDTSITAVLLCLHNLHQLPISHETFAVVQDMVRP